MAGSLRQKQTTTNPLSTTDGRDEREFIDQYELARRTGLSRASITRLYQSGAIPYWQPGGKRCRILFPVSILKTLSTPPATARAAVPGASSPAAKLSGPAPRWLQPPPYTP